MRIGYGWDSHEFQSSVPLKIGGVELPHDKGLAGHSDGDVLLHAITDQLQPCALHRRRDGRLCNGGERDEAERGLTRVVVPLLVLQREHQGTAA